MMGVPNFYRLEFSLASLEAHNSALNTPLDIRGGDLHLSERPGLSAELDMDFIQAHPDPEWE